MSDGFDFSPTIPTGFGRFLGDLTLSGAVERPVRPDAVRGDDPATCIKAADAGALLRDRDLRACVLIGVRRDGRIDVASHGEDAWSCNIIAEWAHGLVSPYGLAQAPFQTAFGLGYDGVPTRLSDAQMDGLAPHVRAFVEAWTHPQAQACPDAG